MSDIAEVKVDGEPVPFSRGADGVIRFSLPHPVSTHEVTIVETVPPVPGPPSLWPHDRLPEALVWSRQQRRDLERVTRNVPEPTPEPARDLVKAERSRSEALELDRFAPTAARLHRMAADREDPPCSDGMIG